MSFSLRYYNKYGIVPKYNQIRNIGVDSLSTHGSHSLDNIMTKRFCELETHKLSFPLSLPKGVAIDAQFERKLEEYINFPWQLKLQWMFFAPIAPFVRKILKIPDGTTTKMGILQVLKRRK